MASKVEGLRAHALDKTKIISIELTETLMATAYNEDFWIKQHEMDPEADIHPDFRLYWIWNEKANLLKKALDMNPFNSDFFAWVDIGYFRTKEYLGQKMIGSIPDDLKRDQDLLLDVSSLVNGQNYIGGGFIGGFVEGVSKWCMKYYLTLESNKNAFIGKDQPWMYRTCEMYPGLCYLVKPNQDHGDPWFFMAPFLTAADILDKNHESGLSASSP